MADTLYPASPQGFTFNGRRLNGVLVSFSGTTARRHVVHEFLKRAGARVEDMQRAPRRLDVTLVFLGPNAAKDYQLFEAVVDRKPAGLLVHPIAGKFQAFCLGPTESVDFSRSTDLVSVRVSFVETALDQIIPIETPDVATASQNASAQIVAMQRVSAAYMAVTGKAQIFVSDVIAAINATAAEIAFAPNPVDSILGVLEVGAGTAAQIVRPMQNIARSMAVLVSTATAYIAAATDLFNGAAVEAGVAASINTLLGNTQTAGDETTDALIAASVTPAGAADAVGSVQETVSDCLLLSEAVRVARPPVILFIVPALTDVITLAQRRYGTSAVARASEILGLNHIPDPGAIPSGTRLIIPSR